jgi:hypothetical protein
MRTVTHAVYDSSSGEVVHVHVEPVGLDTPPEEILQMVALPDLAQLKVMRVPDEIALTGSLRVEKGELRSSGDDATMGAGGIGSPLDEPYAKRTYERLEPRQSK